MGLTRARCLEKGSSVSRDLASSLDRVLRFSALICAYSQGSCSFKWSVLCCISLSVLLQELLILAYFLS